MMKIKNKQNKTKHGDKMKKNVLALAILLLLFSGCSMKNDFNVNLPPDYTSQQFDYQLYNINVKAANDSQRTGPLELPFLPDSFLTSFQASLGTLIDNSGIFSNTSSNDIDIKVTILKNDIPFIGLDMSVETEIEYKIVDKNQEVLYRKVIASKGLATVGEKFVGVDRLMLANDRSVQNNMTLFLNDVQTRLKNPKKELAEQPVEEKTKNTHNSWR